MAEGTPDSHQDLRVRLDSLLRSWPARGPLSILEVGCGTGRASRVSCEHIFRRTPDAEIRVFLLDADTTKVTRAVREVPWPDRPGQSLGWLVGDLYQTPFCGNSFDGVIALNVFHWVERQRFLSEVARLLKPEGRVFLYDRIAGAEATGTKRIMHFELERRHLPRPRR